MPLSIENSEPSTENDSEGFLSKALNFAKGLNNDDVIEDKKQRKNKKSPEEFNTLVIAFVTLATSLTLSEKIRPVENEITIFSNHLSGILARHLNISGKLSADALDIIGLVTVSSLYYARISPELKNRKVNKEIPTQVNNIEEEKSVNNNSPIVSQFVSPETKAFLYRAEQDAINNAKTN